MNETLQKLEAQQPRSCAAAKARGYEASGVYTLDLGGASVDVWCGEDSLSLSLSLSAVCNSLCYK